MGSRFAGRGRPPAPVDVPGPAVRLVSLDALRGVAALVVVWYHALLTVPELADTHVQVGTPDVDVVWVLSHTPLRTFWGGGAAVSLFFVLSGFVLAASTLRPDAARWADYYVRRMARLYLTVAGAVVLAAFWITVVPRVAPDASSWWTQDVARHPSVPGVIKDLLLVWEPGATTSVLWSLKWEVIFSLLLPAYLLLIRLTHRVRWVGLVVSVALVLVGEVAGSGFLYFLPMFAVGCYLAVMQGDLRRLAERYGSRARGRRWIVALGVVQGLSLSWLFRGFGLDGRFWSAVGTAGMMVACAAAVAIGATLGAPRAGRLSSALLWTGSRSFSLYLVHEPIVVSIALLGFGRMSTWWTLPLSLPLALVTTEVFYRAVERPVARFSRTLSWPAFTSVRRDWFRTSV